MEIKIQTQFHENKAETYFHITSCSWCVSSPSAAASLSAFSYRSFCWDTAGTPIPERPWWTLLVQARHCSTRRGRETPRGLTSECGTKVSRRTELWRPRGAAGSSARVNRLNLKLQTDTECSLTGRNRLKTIKNCLYSYRYLYLSLFGNKTSQW